MAILLLSIPGLSRALLKEIPPGSALGRVIAGGAVRDLNPGFPAVTCAVQATLTTGQLSSVHGMVGNGLATYRSPADAARVDASNHPEYRREVSFWEQSNQLLDVPRFWSGSGRKTALLFFQNSMPGFSGTPSPAAEIVLTPKPEHGPDGRITSLLWGSPAGLAEGLQKALGPFPLMHYWGPLAGIRSTAWIAAAAERVLTEQSPDLQLTYLPHLDYDLQRFGPESDAAKRAVADLASAVEGLLVKAEELRAAVVVVSEYAISPVERAIAPNRLLRHAGLLDLRRNAEGPQIDYARSSAFVMCDHQIGHVYLRKESERESVVRVLVEAGIEVLPGETVVHPRAGDLVVQAPRGAWLDYRWWEEAMTTETDPEIVPKWATSIDIHRKPGYDPLELFFAAPPPGLGGPPPMPKGPPMPGTPPVAPPPITSDARRIRGSHGRSDDRGVLICPPACLQTREGSGDGSGEVHARDLAALIRRVW